MNLTLTIVNKTKKTNKSYYTGDDPKISGMVWTGPKLFAAKYAHILRTEEKQKHLRAF